MSNLSAPLSASPPLSAVRATTTIHLYPSPSKDLEATLVPIPPPYRGYAFLETSVLYPLYITSTPPAGMEPHKVFALEPVPEKGVHRIRNILEERYREGEWVWSCDKGGFVEWRKGPASRQGNNNRCVRPPRPSSPRRNPRRGKRPPPLQLRLKIPDVPAVRRKDESRDHLLLVRLPDNTISRVPFPSAKEQEDSDIFRELETAYHQTRRSRRFGFKHLRQIRVGDVRIPWRDDAEVVQSVMKLKGAAVGVRVVELEDGWSWRRLLAAVLLVVAVAAAVTAVWYTCRGESVGAFLLGGLVLLVGSGVVAVGVAVSW